MAGVAALDFNLTQRALTVTHVPGVLPQLIEALESLGLGAAIRAESVPARTAAGQATNWWPLAFSGVAALLAELVYWLNGGNHWVVIALSIVAIATGGLTTYRKGWIALRNRNLNMNALMSIAVTGAMAIGHWPEAAMVMVLFALAEVIEARSLDRARHAIRGLLDLAPNARPRGNRTGAGPRSMPGPCRSEAVYASNQASVLRSTARSWRVARRSIRRRSRVRACRSRRRRVTPSSPAPSTKAARSNTR
jgi:cation transport ATPase